MRPPDRRNSPTLDRAAAETIAAQALGHIASDEDRLWRFVSLTGVELHNLREEASRPEFLAAVLDHVVCDEALLVETAQALDVSPERIVRAQALLSPPPPDDY